ncbi:MAG TPA: metallophosphoesterase [Gemmataceae bacterium]|jgi:3',5'-cyclic AMP phosphodiesterase CpdA|nr:metallophosphoesterase [Gemmataceae bacterium]
MSKKLISRRELLRRSPAALLAAGLWPGTLAAGDATTDAFSFLAVNDLHSLDKKCHPWFEKVVKQMAGHAEKPAFLLISGDLADGGTAEQIAAVKEIFGGLKLPMYTVPGNHDFTPKQERKAYDDLFPDRLNYAFDHGGWQFIALDTTEGTKAQDTKIAAETLNWLDGQLPKLDKKKPLVVFTHFPLGEGVKMRPKNAEEVLKRFLPFNLRAVYSGHFHSFTEKKAGNVVLTTNRCCAFSRGNHDGTKEKGYFLVATKDGKLERTFVEVKPA